MSDTLLPNKAYDAEWYHRSLQYKIGTHGLLMVWINGGWRRSNKTKAEVCFGLEVKNNSQRRY